MGGTSQENEKSAKSREKEQISAYNERDRLAEILDTMTDGILVVDADNNILYANNAVRSLPDLLASKLEFSKFDCSITGNPRVVDIPSGDRTYTVQVTSVPIKWDDAHAYLVILHNITGYVNIPNLLSRLLEARERESGRIASKLHDDIGGALAAIKLIVARAEKIEGTMGGDELQKVIGLLDDTMDMVSEMSHDMQPDILYEFGLLEAFKGYLKQFQSNTGININLSFNLVEDDYPAIIKTTIFRIMQVFLEDITRSKDVNKVNLKIYSYNVNIYIRFEDFNSDMSNIGCLQEIQDLLLLAGGRLVLDSHCDSGSCLICELPSDYL